MPTSSRKWRLPHLLLWLVLPLAGFLLYERMFLISASEAAQRKAELTQLHLEEEQALQLLEQQAMARLDQQLEDCFSELQIGVDRAKKEMSSFNNMAHFTLMLTWDQLRHDSLTGRKIEELIRREIGADLVCMQSEWDRQLRDLEHLLQTQQHTFLAQSEAIAWKTVGWHQKDQQSETQLLQAKFQTEFTQRVNLEHNSLKGGLSMVKGCRKLCSQKSRKLITRLLSKAARRWGQKTLGAVAISQVDGPLPTGDLIAITLVIAETCWAGYDIYRMQADFKQQIDQSMQEALAAHRAKVRAEGEKLIQQRIQLIREQNQRAFQAGLQRIDQQIRHLPF